MRPNNSGKILNFARWFFAVFTALVALVPFSKGGIGILSGIFVWAVAFLISPLSSKLPIKTLPKTIVCVALFFIGLGISPSSSKKSVETVERSITEIVETEQTTTTTAETTATTAASETETSTTPAEKAIADELSDTTTAAETTTTTEATTTAKPTTTTKATTKKKKTTTTPKPATTTTTTTTTSATTTATTTTEQFVVPDKSVGYVVNTNTGKFHYTDCKSVKDIKPENRWDFTGDRAELIAQGYSPCGNCKP